MPRKTYILKLIYKAYNNGEKSMKVPFVIYAEKESLLEKTDMCHNN